MIILDVSIINEFGTSENWQFVTTIRGTVFYNNLWAHKPKLWNTKWISAIHVMMDKYDKFMKWTNQFMYICRVVMRREIKMQSIGHHCLCWSPKKNFLSFLFSYWWISSYICVQQDSLWLCVSVVLIIYNECNYWFIFCKHRSAICVVFNTYNVTFTEFMNSNTSIILYSTGLRNIKLLKQ